MGMAIGRAAERSGCSAPTIRYYEEIGLMRPAGRTPSGRRSYGWPEVARLTFIRRSRDLGLSIEEVRELLAVSDDPAADCGQALDLVKRRLEAARARRRELEALEASLQRMAERCEAGCAGGPSQACCLFDDVLAASA